MVLFSAVAPKGRNFSRSCKEKFFLQKKCRCKKCLSMWSGNVAVGSGNVAVWSGNVAVAKSYVWNYLENLKKRRSANKRLFFRKTYFSSKRQKFSTILKMQVYNIYLDYVTLHYIVWYYMILYDIIWDWNMVYIYIYMWYRNNATWYFQPPMAISRGIAGTRACWQPTKRTRWNLAGPDVSGATGGSNGGYWGIASWKW